MPAWLDTAQAQLARIGVDQMGIADAAAVTSLMPGAAAVVVFGSSTALFTALEQRVAADPDWASRANPLDDLVDEVVRAQPQRPGRRWLRCADDADVVVDFRALAHAAGMGWPSRLGLVLHPELGPWLGLRAAVITTDPLQPTGPLPGRGPCADCAGPCADACPVAAPGPTGLDLSGCLAWQAAHDTCQAGCLARSACPVGQDHAHPPRAHRYHHHPDSRRAVLTELLTGRST